MMTRQITILILVVCFSIAVCTVQTLSQMPIRFPDLRGMTSEEAKKAVQKWRAQIRQQRLKKSEDRMNLMARQAWKRLLRITEQQWKLIEPKNDKVKDLFSQLYVRAGCGGRSEESFHWNRPSASPQHAMEGKARDQMPEGYRVVEELIDLLEDENSKDQQIRQKIDALQQTREKAEKELPKAKQELRAVLTTPRQEAVFLLRGFID